MSSEARASPAFWCFAFSDLIAEMRRRTRYGGCMGKVVTADYHYLSITELSELIRQKKVSPVELVAGCLKRIEQLNPTLNAFISVTTDQALQEAKRAEREIKDGKWKGPLHGLPVGVTGFKATNGLLSIKGILEGEEADETIIRIAHTAFMRRTVEDAAILLNVLANPEVSHSKFKADYRSAFGTTKNSRIGIVKNFKATDEVRTAFLNAVETFRSLGSTIGDIDAPLEFSSFAIGNIEEDRKTISQSLFKDIDVLLLPTTTDVTPGIEEARAGGPQAVSADNTFFCNYYGLPAISIPCGFSKNGLPLGLQIVGPRWGEGNVLDIAHTFQQATRWHLEHPLV